MIMGILIGVGATLIFVLAIAGGYSAGVDAEHKRWISKKEEAGKEVKPEEELS